MLKILHVSGARGWGGNEQQLIDLIYEMSLLKIESIVLGIKGSVLEKECNKQNFTFLQNKEKKLNTFSNYRFFKNSIKEVRPDIVHLHTSDSLTLYVLTDLIYGINLPVVFSKKGMGSSSSILSNFKYNYRNLSGIICVSKKVRTEFSQTLTTANQKKIQVIYDGISPSRMSEAKESIKQKFGIDNAKTIIGHIGNHVHAKDLPTLIKMMNILVNDLGQKNVHLIQIGEHKEEITNRLINSIKEYRLEEHITLAGFVPDASSYLSQFEVFGMSSEREGFPLTIYEAFYKKTPVASTKAGGIPEIITDAVNGYLTEIGDFQSLAERIRDLLQDENKRNSFTNNAFKNFIENYTSAKCAMYTVEFYNQFMK